MVTGNTQATSTLNVRPNLPLTPGVGDVLELYTKHGGGPLIADINSAINRAIRDAAENNLVEVVATAVAFNPDAPTYTIPAGWVGLIGAEWQDADVPNTWYSVSWRKLDPVGRTVVVTGWNSLTGSSVRLRGYSVPAELTNESATTALNAEWLVNRASYHALMSSAAKRTPSEANQALGMAQAFREEAMRTQSLVRPRLKLFTRLGAI